MRDYSCVSWLPLSILTLGCIGAILRWPALWSQKTQASQRKPGWWPYDVANWRGWVRGMPVGIAGAAFLLVAAWPAAVEGWSVQDHTAVAVLVLIGSTGLMLCCALMASIMLVNRPRAFVPPQLRHQQGALHTWRRRRRSRL